MYETEHRWCRYDKKFAIIPVKCTCGWIWLKTYYRKYIVYSYKEINDILYFECNLLTEDCIIDKLVEDL